MELKLHYTPTSGYTPLVAPTTQPISELLFGMLWLPPGEQYNEAGGDAEVGLVILTGNCAITVGSERFADLGGRDTVFAGRATGVYVPLGASFRVEAGRAGVEIACCRCRTDTHFPAQVIRPADVVVRDVGGPGFRRYVHDIFGAQMQASRMIVGETYTIAGNWSSYPPHKHDVEQLPDEVRQEELYFYKIRPVEGFGVQYLYSPAASPRGALDQAVGVRDNDITLMPFGYHPVAAPPGYDVYYLWFLSGPTRLLRPKDDPEHAWVKTMVAPEREYPT